MDSTTYNVEREKWNILASKDGAALQPIPPGDDFYRLAGRTSTMVGMGDLAGPQLYRVLKSNRRATFSEPMGMNPLLRFARDHVPCPHKNPRGAHVPLDY